MSKIYPYAGFWKRTVAFIIDSVILSIPMLVGFAIIMHKFAFTILSLEATKTTADNPESFATMMEMYVGVLLLQAFSFLLFWLYNAWLESSSWQATLGKKCMGIKVVDHQGGRISFWRATGRTFSKWISSAILYIGFLMAGTTAKKQALHDFICSTFVVDETYQPGQPLEEVPTHPVLLGLGIVAALLFFIMPFVLMGLGVATAIMQEGNTLEESSSDTTYQEIFDRIDNLRAVTTLVTLQEELPNTRPAFEERGFRFSFDEDGIRATPLNDKDFALVLPEGSGWPCCEPLAGEDSCKKVMESITTLEKCAIPSK